MQKTHEQRKRDAQLGADGWQERCQRRNNPAHSRPTHGHALLWRQPAIFSAGMAQRTSSSKWKRTIMQDTPLPPELNTLCNSLEAFAKDILDRWPHDSVFLDHWGW